MLKNIILATLFLGTVHVVTAQKYLNPKNVQLGTSFTYMPNYNEKTIYGKGEVLYNWAFNISTSVSPKIQVGIENMMLWHTEYSERGLVRSNMFGAFSQYSLFSDKKINFFLEGSVHYGNYCSCDPFMPFRKEGLWYYGLGLGFNKLIRKDLVLDLAFNNYQIFNKIPLKYNNTRYVIGINYLINFKKTVRSNG